MNRTVYDHQDDFILSSGQGGRVQTVHSHTSPMGIMRMAGRILARWNNQVPHLTAIEALEQYKWSVFPLDAEKKPPRIGGMHQDGTPRRLSWHVYQTQQVSKNALLAWARHYVSPAWAVITGALSGVIVLDFDGSEGIRLMSQLGLAPHVRTGSGGYHIYFAHPGWPVKTLNGKSASELGHRWPGRDIRADGGYAAFCGHNTHGRYEWLRLPMLEPTEKLPDDLRLALGLLHAPGPRIPHEPDPPKRHYNNACRSRRGSSKEHCSEWACRGVIMQASGWHAS